MSSTSRSGGSGGTTGADGRGGPPADTSRGTPVAPLGPPPPFDPELAAALEAMGDAAQAGFDLESLDRRRAELAELAPSPSLEELRAGGDFEITEHVVPGPEGAPDISLVVALPTGLSGALPVIYHNHGGGMIIGDSRTGLAQLLDEWGRGLGMAVVSVQYRLAPEHPHPAPVEDCYAGLLWTAAHATELGVDAGRIVIAGGSAGGGLTAGLALLARDRSGPGLLGQLLMCPMIDDRNDTPSARQMSGRGLWDREANHAGWTALLGERRGGPDVSPYAAPARAVDLSGLPPAYIDVGSAETFRDEDVAYANRIWQAGGQAELHVWQGGFHGFEGMAPQAAVSRAARTARLDWLKRLLDR